jgi:hypothetical protein
MAKERYSIRLDPELQAQLKAKHGTLQAAVERALSLDHEDMIRGAESYAYDHAPEEEREKMRTGKGRWILDPTYWLVFAAFRDGYRAAKGLAPGKKDPRPKELQEILKLIAERDQENEEEEL